MDRYFFDKELNTLKEKLMDMSKLVQTMLTNAITALKDRNESLLEKVFQDEEVVNMHQITIDDEALKLIACQQPAASDLRWHVNPGVSESGEVHP